MARNLAKHKASHPVPSPPLLVFNRSLAKCEKLVQELGGEAKGKVRIAQSAAELAIECDVIITNLANDDVIRRVYAEFAKALTVRIISALLRFGHMDIESALSLFSNR
jgi:3-hydroxyisobutyrate dehydrogenase-like beta-hydroxyacid dehydrogenase